MVKGVRRSLAKILAIAMASFLIVVVAMPSQSQTPQPETREAIVQDIKESAKSHVELGVHRGEQVIKQYEARAKKVGMGSDEIGKIYDKEYERLKNNKENDWWDILTGGRDIKLIIVLSLLGVVLTAFKSWFEKGANYIGQKIVNIFVGSIIYNGYVNSYRQALRTKYSNVPVTFRPNRPLQMGQVYVPLKVAGTSDTAQIDAYKAVADYRKLVVIGPPGSGKSMLLKDIILRYGKNGLLDLPKRPIAIYLELHRLSDRQKNLEEYLVDALDRDRFPAAKAFVSENLKKGRLMLLLDGLDEVNSNERPGVIQEINDLLDRLEDYDCRAIITCRTAIYRNDFHERVDQTLEVVEFNDQQMREFLSPWESDMPEDKSIEQLMQTLHARPPIKIVARNPLMLTMIACLYTDNDDFVLPHSRAEFYEKATQYLLDELRHEYNVYEAPEKRSVLQHLALYFQDNANQQQDRRSLPYREVLDKVEEVLRNPEEAKPLLKEIVQRSGLFLEIDKGDRYQFAHLTLQEFFAAEALKENGEELVNRFLTDPSAWRETAKLWCGLATDSTRVIGRIGRKDPITAFECLADARNVEPALAQRIINKLKVWLMDADRNDSDQIVRAFAAIAADNRPKGQDAFQFLEETLADNNPARRLTAAKTLSLTNLPKAVQVLASHYNQSSEVREHLVQMGDLAVPALADLSAQGWHTAMDDLLKIGTPEAAEKLVPLLWNVDENLAASAAWRLAALLPQSNVEEVLRNYQITEEQKQAKWLDWIWQPFDEPIHSALPVIAGRIAYLLGKVLVRNVDLESLPPLDPRIIVPICSIEVIGERERSVLNKFRKEISKWTEKQEQIVNGILNAPNALTRWQNLLRSLSPSIKVDLLHRLLSCDRDHLPTRVHWVNIFQKLEYEFKTSSNYYGILWLAVSISVMALAEIDYFILDTQLVLYKKIIWFSASLVIVSLLRSFFGSKPLDEEENIVEPQDFIDIYYFGIRTFIFEFIESWAYAGGYCFYLMLSGINNSYLVKANSNGESAGRILQTEKWQNVISAALFHIINSFLIMTFSGIGFLAVHLIIISDLPNSEIIVLLPLALLAIIFASWSGIKNKFKISEGIIKWNQLAIGIIIAIVYLRQGLYFVNIILEMSQTWTWNINPISQLAIGDSLRMFLIGIMILILAQLLSMLIRSNTSSVLDELLTWLGEWLKDRRFYEIDVTLLRNEGGQEIYGNLKIILHVLYVGFLISLITLSLPLFFCLPIVFCLGSYRLWRLFSLLQFAGLWELISISIFWLIFIGISRWLWCDGQKRDRNARNPLHGIIKSRSKL